MSPYPPIDWGSMLILIVIFSLVLPLIEAIWCRIKRCDSEI